MTRTDDARTTAVVLLTGATLAGVGNGLHPFVETDTSVASFLETIDEHGAWPLLHLGIALAVVMLAAGIAMVCRALADTAAGALASLAATLATVGATIFAIQIGGIDGAVMHRLAEAHASGEHTDAVLATATGMNALDLALLGLVVTIYFGGLFLAFGLALVRAAVFAPWIRSLAIASGTTGVIVGPMMFLDLAAGFTFVAFRLVALAATVVAFAVATQLLRGTAGMPTIAGPGPRVDRDRARP